MRRLLASALLATALAGPVAAMPPAIDELVRQSDDDPRAALLRIELSAGNAESAKDLDTAFWLALARAQALARLERHGEAEQQVLHATALLKRIAQPGEDQRLWLEFVTLDAGAALNDRAAAVRAATALRERVEVSGRPRLACDIRGLELWLLLDMRSDDEAWYTAEALERCGQQFGSPSMVSTARLALASVTRLRMADGETGLDPEPYLEGARQALADRPARFQRSLIEWESGIALRLLKRPEAALERLQRARALSDSLGDEAGIGAAGIEMAAVQLDLKRPAAALPLLDDAAQRLAAGGEGDLVYRMPRITELRLLALVALGGPRLAAEVARGERWTADDVMPVQRARVLQAMARAQAALGRHAAAYETLQRAQEAERQGRAGARDAQVARLQARYDSARRETENAELRLHTEAARLQAQTEQARNRFLLTGVAALAALAVLGFVLAGRQLAHRRRMADLALRDELTGQPNRRAVQAYAHEQFEQARRLDLPFAVAVIDFDHFKQVNDRHGHAAGDAVLRAFAQAAHAVLRGQDRLGRWGGEEWLLVMPGTRLAEVESVFARLRERFAITLVPGAPAGLRVTFSMGAAERRGNASLEQLIEAADRALYRAKLEGRDRLASDDDPGEPAAA